MKKLLFIILLLVVAGGSVYYFGFYGNNPANISETVSDDSGSGETVDENAPLLEEDPVFKEPVSFSALKESYSHTGFSFKYSEGFKVSSSTVEGGEMVAVENEKGSGFQIFFSSFDEPGPITPERIWQDMPDMAINDPKNADLDGSKALVFYGSDEVMGETFEVWTVRRGKLYQITGPKTAEQLIIETLETWTWSR